jgi:enamine deaminase RidA (YjgF/YER057c/UK114 family)
LVGDEEHKYPPLFSRGLIFEDSENYQIFVSGTSSISGEESLGTSDIGQAINSTIQNIQKVIDPTQISEILKKKIMTHDIDIKFARVYLKNDDNRKDVQKVINQIFPNVAVSYLIADICRPELLIEIEVYAEIEKKFA